MAIKTLSNLYEFYKKDIQNDPKYNKTFKRLCDLSRANAIGYGTDLEQRFYDELKKDLKTNPAKYNQSTKQLQEQTVKMMQQYIARQAQEQYDREVKNKTQNLIKGILHKTIDTTIFYAVIKGVPMEIQEYNFSGDFDNPPDYELDILFPPADHLILEAEKLGVDTDEFFEGFSEIPYADELTQAIKNHDEEIALAIATKKKEVEKSDKSDEEKEEEINEYTVSLEMQYPLGIDYVPEDFKEEEMQFLKDTGYMKAQEMKKRQELQQCEI